MSVSPLLKKYFPLAFVAVNVLATSINIKKVDPALQADDSVALPDGYRPYYVDFSPVGCSGVFFRRTPC